MIEVKNLVSNAIICIYGMLNYIAHGHLDISTDLSNAATKNSNPMKQDFKELLLVVDYQFWCSKR
jgi:hypothetical protein